MAYRGFKPTFVHRELVASSQLLTDPWLKKFAYVWVSDDNIDYRNTNANALVRHFRASGAVIGQPVKGRNSKMHCNTVQLR